MAPLGLNKTFASDRKNSMMDASEVQRTTVLVKEQILKGILTGKEQDPTQLAYTPLPRRGSYSDIRAIKDISQPEVLPTFGGSQVTNEEKKTDKPARSPLARSRSVT